MQRISIISAMSENHVIGVNNALPWSLPEDWENFRKVTRGKAFLMGRNSYESPDALVSDYRNIVLSSRTNWPSIPKVQFAQSVKEAFNLLKDEQEFFILGGAAVFEQTLHLANYLYLTIVHHEFEGDAFFPSINWKKWQLVKSRKVAVDEKHAYSFSLNEYKRVLSLP